MAATILNRVKDPRYPDTIPGVIYQYNHGFQYCPVRNAGRYGGRQMKMPTERLKRRWRGKTPTGGALSFFNPAKSFNRWIRSGPYLIKIGNHIFVR